MVLFRTQRKWLSLVYRSIVSGSEFLEFDKCRAVHLPLVSLPLFRLLPQDRTCETHQSLLVLQMIVDQLLDTFKRSSTIEKKSFGAILDAIVQQLSLRSCIIDDKHESIWNITDFYDFLHLFWLLIYSFSVQNCKRRTKVVSTGFCQAFVSSLALTLADWGENRLTVTQNVKCLTKWWPGSFESRTRKLPWHVSHMINFVFCLVTPGWYLEMVFS